jgi:hypothetical protein
MSIKDIGKKIKPYWENRVNPLFLRVKDSSNIREDIFIVLAVILIGLSGFGLGKLSALEKSRGEVEIEKADFILATSTINKTIKAVDVPVPMSAAAMVASENSQGLLVASKSGQKYHFPWCPGASQIADKNKIWFDSYEQAQKAGYTPATNCKGLK